MKHRKILSSVALLSLLGIAALPGTAAAHSPATDTVRVISVSHDGHRHAPGRHTHHKRHKHHRHQHGHQARRPLGYAPPPVHRHPPRPVYYESYPPAYEPRVSIRIRL